MLRNLPGVDYTFSPNQNLIYLNQAITNQEFSTLEVPLIILDLSTLAQRKITNYKYRINQISKNNQYALSYDFKKNSIKNAFIFDLKTNEKIFELPGKLLSLTDDFSLALLEIDSETKLYDIANKESIINLLTQNNYLSKNDQVALFFDRNNLLSIWKKTTNKITTLNHFTDCFALSYDGKQAL